MIALERMPVRRFRRAHDFKRRFMSYLRKGVSGEPVKILQAKLGVPADGDFGPATETALKAYQDKHHLAVDGVAGPDTFMELGLSELVLLAQGAQGATVKKLQEALGVGADGQFGPGTEKALRAFQQAHGLDVDGVAGPETLAKLPAFASAISPAQVAASQLAPAASQAAAAPAAQAAAPMAAHAAVLPALDSKAPAIKAPAKSIWATVKGWL